MQVNEIRSYITNLKIHIDQVDTWVRQATDMVYAIEEGLMDIEDAEMERRHSYKKYRQVGNMGIFNEAASGIYHLIDSPPRLNSSRCSEDHIAAAGFYQS